MLDSFFVKKFFNIGIPKLGVIVLQKEHPSEAGNIINNYKTVFVTANAYISDVSKQVHV